MRVIRLPFLLPRMQAVTVCKHLVLARRDSTADHLDHEYVHVDQRVRDGDWRFNLRYLTSGRWRALYELEAYAVDVLAFERTHPGISRSGVIVAHVDLFRSSWLYRWLPGRLPGWKECIAMLTDFVDERTRRLTC